MLTTLCRLSDIVLIDDGLHDTIELCFVAKNALQELIEVAMRIAAKAVSDGVVAYMATGFLEISDAVAQAVTSEAGSWSAVSIEGSIKDLSEVNMGPHGSDPRST